MIKINVDELENIGIVSHYINKPFTGLAFVLNNKGEEKTVTEFKNGLKLGKLINNSYNDLRFPSMREKFKYILYYEEDKCINYGENYIKMAVNKAYAEFCLDEFNGIKLRNKAFTPKENWKKCLINEIRWDVDIKIIDNALHEIFQKLDEKIENNINEVNFFKDQNDFMKMMGLDNTRSMENLHAAYNNRIKAIEKMNAVEDQFENEMNSLEEKRKDSKNIKNWIKKLFKEKIDAFYVQYYYQGEGLEDEDAEWGDDNGEWGPEDYEKHDIQYVGDKIHDFIYDYFEPSNYLETDAYCLLKLTNNKLTFSMQEDTENAVEFDFDKMQHNEKEFSEDYIPLSIKWDITNDGIIEIK